MIISRTPLRISLGGGGTDLPSYYETTGRGFLVASAIDKYIYIAAHQNFEDKILLKYSQIENKSTIDEIEHGIFREALRFTGSSGMIELTSVADIPAGTGLGSSGTFTVGVLNALSAYAKKPTSAAELAKNACHIEIDVLGEPVGKQDQYIAAHGGLTAFEFLKDGTVITQSVNLSSSGVDELSENLLLFFTGIRRSASEELARTKQEASQASSGIKANLDEVMRAGYLAAETLEAGDLNKFATSLTDQWKLKYLRSPSPTHDTVDSWINQGIEAGAAGGKLVGAGGGGFLLFYSENKAKLRRVMGQIGLKEVKFNFDFHGTTIL